MLELAKNNKYITYKKDLRSDTKYVCNVSTKSDKLRDRR